MSKKLSNNEIQERLKKEAEQKLTNKTKQLQGKKEVKK